MISNNTCSDGTPELLDDVAEIVDFALCQKLTARNVDADVERTLQARPLVGDGLKTLVGLQGLAKHPAPHRNDHTSFFGERDETRRHDVAVDRMVPADEGFVARDTAARQVNDRLIIQRKRLAFDGALEVVREFAPLSPMIGSPFGPEAGRALGHDELLQRAQALKRQAQQQLHRLIGVRHMLAQCGLVENDDLRFLDRDCRCRTRFVIDERRFTQKIAIAETCQNDLAAIPARRHLDIPRLDHIGEIAGVSLTEDLGARREYLPR